MLPFAPSFYKDTRSAILEYASVDFHHLLATSANQALHFPKLREQENIHLKVQQHEAARQARLNKKLEKMTPVEDFSDCCKRYSTSSACCAHCQLIFFYPVNTRSAKNTCSAFVVRKCLTGLIPQRILKHSREKFLNFPNRAQRKSFILSLRTPKCK